MSTTKKADTSTFGERLRSVRSRLNLNQSEMALQIGVSKDTLSRYERGELTPSIDVLKRIVESYSSEGISADYLLLDSRPQIPTYRVENVGWATGLDFQDGGSFEIGVGFKDLAKLCESMVVFSELNIPLTDALLAAADALRDVNEGVKFNPNDPFEEANKEIDEMSYLEVTVPIAQQSAKLLPTFAQGNGKKDKIMNKYLKELAKVEKLQNELAALKKLHKK
ncbi:helix-turn-helix transcriptional regulator [Vibrio fluvialis]|uniref:helix-turn-helix domain-containing protein n=1 Tax=Vibrio fluvialis TaxID=676 RepID=UPI00192A9DC3|nr:helix-turn-helix transcriptional regulator [Vibrio fluvialis]EGR0723401.1 XRE family transcriptional regulator [Vibrio cholerae]MBL4279710.1 helix-turn-helix transcriptional regulator [Vibrio fluvialis]